VDTRNLDRAAGIAALKSCRKSFAITFQDPPAIVRMKAAIWRNLAS